MIYSGKLVYNSNGEYELHNGKIVNLSNMLKKVYYHPTNNYINIKIMNGSRLLFNEDGNLHYKPIGKHFYSLHVDGEDLETILFESTDKDLEVKIYAEVLMEEALIKNETNKK